MVPPGPSPNTLTTDNTVELVWVPRQEELWQLEGWPTNKRLGTSEPLQGQLIFGALTRSIQIL